MDYFSISDIEHLSGIKAHTLRIWEQRYRILVPKRKESKHRFYDNEDLKRILQIAHLNRNGHKISKIARMTDEQIRTLTLQEELNESIYENFIHQFMEACRNFDEDRFNKFFHTVYQHLGFEKTVLHIFYPVLERIGRNWMTDQVMPVQEHFASNMISRKIQLAIQHLGVSQKGPLTILFNPENEHHEIPLLFIHYLLKRKGKRVVYFGADVSFEQLEEFTHRQKTDRLHLHLITNLTPFSPDDLVQHLLQKFPKQQIVLSGPYSGTIKNTNNRLRLLTSSGALLHYCDED
jgi:DNA-binding transcriptional MerR regulator